MVAWWRKGLEEGNKKTDYLASIVIWTSESCQGTGFVETNLSGWEKMGCMEIDDMRDVKDEGKEGGEECLPHFWLCIWAFVFGHFKFRRLLEHVV